MSTIMNILGVNGWYTRSHDASAAIIQNGFLKCFIEEERITRYRHAFEQLPHRAIDHCLRIAGLRASDIDVLAVGWDYHKKYHQRSISIPKCANDLAELYLPKKIFSYNRCPAVDIIEHHKAHAA